MKINRQVFGLICLFICFAIFCSCSPDKEGSSSQKGTASNNSAEQNNSSLTSATQNKGTETLTEFESQIKNNPIDKAIADTSLKADYTNSDLINAEKENAALWEKELEFSCENLKALLNDENKKALGLSQEAWKKHIDSTYKFVSGIYYDNNIETGAGTGFMLEHISNYTKAIRQRTIYIKYLQYCIEVKIGEDYIVEFQYQYK